MLFALSGFLIGAMLGRFTVLALIPAMACAVIIAGPTAFMLGGTNVGTFIDLAVLIASVQIGYLGAAALGSLLQGTGGADGE
jgi:hypothetical protein